MSEFWIRKVRTFFHVLDFNKDDLVTKEDFEKIADRFGEDVDEVQRVVQKLSFLTVFNIFEEVAGSDGQITEQGLIEALKKLRTDPGFAGLIRSVATLLFYFLETDGDKYIREAGFVRFFKYLGLPDPERQGMDALEDVDTDHDGKVSLAEIGDAFVNYLKSDDEEDPGSKLLGDLVDWFQSFPFNVSRPNSVSASVFVK